MLIHGGRMSSGTRWTDLTLWLVLDELDQFVAVDHLARREGEVAPRREGLGVHDAQPPLLEVVHQVAHSLRKARAPRLDCPAQCDRICDEQQRRTHRVHELAEVELQVLPLRRAQVLSLARLAQQPVRGEEVEFLERAKNRVALPLGRGEALVRAAGSRRLGPRQPAPALPCLVPGVHRRLPLPQIEVGGGHRALGSADGPQPDGAQGPGDLRPVHRNDLAQRVRAKRIVGGAQDRSQDRVLGRHVTELLQAASELIGRHLP